MANCPYNGNCPYANGNYKTQIQSLIRLSYCSSNYENCARYILKTNINTCSVPIDLFPHEKSRIMSMLNSNALQVHT